LPGNAMFPGFFYACYKKRTLCRGKEMMIVAAIQHRDPK